MSKRTHSEMEGGAPVVSTVTLGDSEGQPLNRQGQTPLVLEEHQERGLAVEEEEQQRKRRRPIGTTGDAPYMDRDSALAALDDPRVLTKRKALAFLLTDSIHLLSSSTEALLCRRVKVEPEPGVRCMLVRCLVRLAQAQSASANVVTDELARQLATSSKDVRVAALAGLRDIYEADLASASDTTADGVLHHAALLLRSSHHTTRQKAVLLLNALRARRLERDAGHIEAHQRLLADYGSNDPDPRVRAAAFKCLKALHEKAVELSLELYEVATLALDDDFPRVRLHAMDVLVILCNLHKDELHDRGRGEMMRMADDGFIRVCSMVMDASVEVRATACRQLGRIGHVDTRYLVQAFSKEILGQSGRGRLAKSKSNTAAAAGDFDLSTSADVDLLGSGAGAFVLGLEDEFHEVRTAAIDSIRQLAASSLPFARVAVDFMVDMFNDEIDTVRSNAIHSLREMAEVVLLQEDQVHITLAVLHDTSAEIRWATYRLLAAIPLCNIQCTHSTVQALLATMERQPEDTMKIYEALAGVGANHGHFLEYLVEDLLEIDSHFLPVEKSGDDEGYVGLLIALCNAAVSNRNILALLPPYAARHYGFLKEKHPSLFPQSLSFASSSSLPKAAHVWRVKGSKGADRGPVPGIFGSRDEVEEMDSLFCSAWTQMLADAPPPPAKCLASQRDQLRKRARELVQEITRMAQVSPALRVRAACYRAISSCLCIASSATVSVVEAGKLLQTTYEVENTYIGLSSATLGRLAVLRTIAHLQLLSLEQETVSHSLSGLQRRLKSLAEGELPEELRASVCSALDTLTGGGSLGDLEKVSTALQPSPWPLGPAELRRVQSQTWAPVTDPEAPIIFNAESDLRIKFAAHVVDVPPGTSLVVLCKLPDYSTVAVPLQKEDMESIGEARTHVTKELSIPIAQRLGWTEQCAVELQLVRVFQPDLDGDCKRFGAQEGSLTGTRPMVALQAPTLVWAHAAEQASLNRLRSRK